MVNMASEIDLPLSEIIAKRKITLNRRSNNAGTAGGVQRTGGIQKAKNVIRPLMSNQHMKPLLSSNPKEVVDIRNHLIQLKRRQISDARAHLTNKAKTTDARSKINTIRGNTVGQKASSSANSNKPVDMRQKLDRLQVKKTPITALTSSGRAQHTTLKKTIVGNAANGSRTISLQRTVSANRFTGSSGAGRSAPLSRTVITNSRSAPVKRLQAVAQQQQQRRPQQQQQQQVTRRVPLTTARNNMADVRQQQQQQVIRRTAVVSRGLQQQQPQRRLQQQQQQQPPQRRLQQQPQRRQQQQQQVMRSPLTAGRISQPGSTMAVRRAVPVERETVYVRRPAQQQQLQPVYSDELEYVEPAPARQAVLYRPATAATVQRRAPPAVVYEDDLMYEDEYEPQQAVAQQAPVYYADEVDATAEPYYEQEYTEEMYMPQSSARQQQQQYGPPPPPSMQRQPLMRQQPLFSSPPNPYHHQQQPLMSRATQPARRAQPLMRDPPAPVRQMRTQAIPVMRQTQLSSAGVGNRILGYKVSVGNLHAATREDIEELFGNIGPISSCKMVREDTAMVVFLNHADAKKSVEAYHNRRLDNFPMQVKIVGTLSEAPLRTR